MNPGEYDYDEAARAGNPAAYVAKLSEQELQHLCAHTEGIMRQNETKGGWPAVVKWLCVIEAAKRYLTPPPPAP